MGCFTSTFYSFINRPWETKVNLSYSVRTPLSKIVAEIRGSRIMRILPYVDENEWIPNNSRIQKKEVIYINPEIFFEFNIKAQQVLGRKLRLKESNFLLSFRRALEVFLIRFEDQKKTLGLIVNAYVDLKESYTIRSLEMLASHLKIKKYFLNA